MDETTSTSLPRIRTFARDLEIERKKHGITNPTSSSAPTDQTPIPAVAVSHTPPPPIPPAPTPTPQRAAPALPHINATTPVSPAVPKYAPTENETGLTPIPPFHALTKERRTEQSANYKPAQIEHITIENDESAATVITDTKRDRFNFFSSTAASFKAWWKSYLRARKLKKIPKYVVPETDRRKGIIQRATSQSGKVVTSDNAQLREQIMRRSSTPPPPPHEPETVWTPNTETIFPLLEAPEPTHITNVQVTPRTQATPVPATEPVVAPPPPIIETPPVILPPPVAATPPVVAPSPAATPPPAPPVVAEVPPTEEVPTVEVPPARPAALRTRPTNFWPMVWERALATNTITFAAATTAIVALFVLTAFQYNRPTEPTGPAPSLPLNTSRPATAPAGTEAIAVIDVPTLTRSALITAIASRLATTGAPQEMYVTTGGISVPASTFLTILDGTIDQNFALNVTNLQLGWISATHPYIELSVNDRTSALGGMLRWERTMASALNPIFTISESAYRKPFIDSTAIGYDLRFVTNSSNQEELVYGFINNQTILIAPNVTIFLDRALATTP